MSQPNYEKHHKSGIQRPIKEFIDRVKAPVARAVPVVARAVPVAAHAAPIAAPVARAALDITTHCLRDILWAEDTKDILRTSFNPSIAHIKDDLYLMAYRSFYRYALPVTSVDDDDRLTGDLTFQANHPWLGGKGSTTIWKHNGSGKDITRFAIIKWKKGLLPQCTLLNTEHEAIDVRVLSYDNNKFILVADDRANINTEISGGRRANPKGEQYNLMSMWTAELDDDKLIIGKKHVICPMLSTPSERNWSPWIYKDKLHFNYGLTLPRFRTFYIDDIANGRCNVASDRLGSDYYVTMEKFYAAANCKISCSTPAILYHGMYLSAGHIRFTLDGLPPGSPLQRYCSKYKDMRLPPYFLYLMFFYTFDPETRDLVKIGKIFSPLPTNGKYMLYFASGLTYTKDNDIMLSYGSQDADACFTVIDEKNIIDLLPYNLSTPIEQIEVITL